MAQGMSMQALERAVRLINGIISRTQSEGHDAAPHSKAKAKWVSIAARGRSKVPVRQSSAAGRRLAAYLALPVEQYSLLDPTWVERQPGSDGVFCLKAPLRGLTGVDLEPRIWVGVEPGDRAVTFSSERASLGDAALDERFSLSLDSMLSFTEDAGGAAGAAEEAVSLACEEEEQRPSATAAGLPEDAQRCNQKATLDSSSTSTSATAAAVSRQAARVRAQSAASMRAFEARQEPDRALLRGPPAQLHARVRVSMRVRLGPPLTAVPGALLRTAGGLVAGALLRALMPVLLDLLARDYERWAAGEERVGSRAAILPHEQKEQTVAVLGLEL